MIGFDLTVKQNNFLFVFQLLEQHESEDFLTLNFDRNPMNYWLLSKRFEIFVCLAFFLVGFRVLKCARKKQNNNCNNHNIMLFH
jgi:hypothetical protein